MWRNTEFLCPFAIFAFFPLFPINCYFVLHILAGELYSQIISSIRIDVSYWFAVCFQEEQVARVRQGMSERVQQLESQIQGKLEQARERRETIEREQKEKLRNHVSF